MISLYDAKGFFHVDYPDKGLIGRSQCASVTVPSASIEDPTSPIFVHSIQSSITLACSFIYIQANWITASGISGTCSGRVHRYDCGELRLQTRFEADLVNVAGRNRSLPRRTLMNYPIPALLKSRTGCLSEPTTDDCHWSCFTREVPSMVCTHDNAFMRLSSTPEICLLRVVGTSKVSPDYILWVLAE